MQAYRFGAHGGDGASEFEYAADVQRVATGIVNSYLVGTAARWILVDTGITGFARVIRRAAVARFGAGARPDAIILTHAHFDHAGNADALALEWQVPVYAHPLEMPYLTGRSKYPPQDPTVGGAIALMSRAFPHRGRTLRANLMPLRSDIVPAAPEWRWIHTPGHTAGHVSLFRDSDGTLLSGDAFVTMNLDSWVEQVRRTPEPCSPPAPLTTDWDAARRSVQTLASLRPYAVGSGHGLPIAGDGVADEVDWFARTFSPPEHGRYVAAPARTGPEGVEYLPPPVHDPFPRRATGAALVVIGAMGLARAARWRGRSQDSTSRSAHPAAK